ncbi:MAG TPA: acylphosphatase [Candidatus Binataceae bacterium]|nr:acylphosphatase [Candidatus Binataceae bacterium]
MNGSTDLARIELRVTGRVQGVYFRAATKAQAEMLGLTGYARNRPDGSVEIVAEGPKAKLEKLYRFAQQGPPDAAVGEVFVAWGTFACEFDRFSVR